MWYFLQQMQILLDHWRENRRKQIHCLHTNTLKRLKLYFQCTEICYVLHPNECKLCQAGIESRIHKLPFDTVSKDNDYKFKKVIYFEIGSLTLDRSIEKTQPNPSKMNIPANDWSRLRESCVSTMTNASSKAKNTPAAANFAYLKI